MNPLNKAPLSPLLFGAVLLVSASAALAACPSVPTASRFTASLDSDGVTPIVADSKSGLIWKRCTEGQSWSATSAACTGIEEIYIHENALAHATSVASSSGKPWRLPDIRELFALADKGCQSPAIDTNAFPGATGNFYWASSPVVSSSSMAWFVDFKDGSASYILRNYRYAVRLVRSNP